MLLEYSQPCSVPSLQDENEIYSHITTPITNNLEPELDVQQFEKHTQFGNDDIKPVDISNVTFSEQGVSAGTALDNMNVYSSIEMEETNLSSAKTDDMNNTLENGARIGTGTIQNGNNKVEPHPFTLYANMNLFGAADAPSNSSFVTSKPVEQWNFDDVGVWLRDNSISKPTIESFRGKTVFFL